MRTNKDVVISREEFKVILEHVERSMYQLDPLGDPDSTQFSYCTSCYRPDWKKHDENCGNMKLLEKFKGHLK